MTADRPSVPRVCRGQQSIAVAPGRWASATETHVRVVASTQNASGKVSANTSTYAVEQTPIKTTVTPTGKIPVLSLFCGAGGLDLGFERVGFHPVLAIDQDPVVLASYDANRLEPATADMDLSLKDGGSILRLLKMRGIIEPPVGVIGGPPCQAFSQANVFKRSDDPRSFLTMRYASILRHLNSELNIDFFVFENVIGITRAPHGGLLKLFKEEIEQAGFNVYEGELDGLSFGVPQRRRRIFVVGLNSSKFDNIGFSFPAASISCPLTVRDTIGNLGEPLFFRRDLDPKEIKELAGHQNHWTMRPRSKRFPIRKDDLHSRGIRSRSLRILDWEKPSPTIAYGHREIYVHPDGLRRLSIFESMLLQGFPREYVLTGSLSAQVRMVSDAVSPPVAQALAMAIKQQLYDASKICTGNAP